MEQIPEMIEILGFPIVLKNPGKIINENILSFPFKVLYAWNEEELRTYIKQHCQIGAYPLFQEYVKGEMHNLCCFGIEGNVVAIHEYHSIRRKKGSGVLRKIVELNQDLAKHTCDLIGALKWDGVAHIAFVLDKDQRKKWYMETNGHFWASTEGSTLMGWDFPYWTYKYFLYGIEPEPGGVKIGSKTCWHLGDLWLLLNYIRWGETLDERIQPGKLIAIIRYFRSFLPGVHSDVFRWADPMPAISEHIKYFQEIWRGAIKKLK